MIMITRPLRPPFSLFSLPLINPFPPSFPHPKTSFLPEIPNFADLFFPEIPNFADFSQNTMAQRTEKEETEFKSLTLCINNCGGVGNPLTNNMCQKCFHSSSTSATSSTQQSRVRSGSLRSPTRSTTSSHVPMVVDRKVVVNDEELINKPATKVVSRCSGCRKRVGLTGFRCRCGDLFCGEHRYSDRHDCTYDYKTSGREAIERDNPVVKAAKIVRI